MGTRALQGALFECWEGGTAEEANNVGEVTPSLQLGLMGLCFPLSIYGASKFDSNLSSIKKKK
ncbi:hypothetical protein TorRG33x02_187350 [Trema orientale]|uniref:Uncharacterized protein n=1 Tax=Trema orientale TaxID=63057 RepID=A0A2P5EIU9_TREOI|nr:hypothetical protein TorRG33x02_187350 [Trema orientale]